MVPRDDVKADPLVTAAGRLLRAEGPHALSTRRLAAAAGTSTQAIYTRYGGKAGVLRAMYREGFERLGAHLAAVPTTGDPVERVHALGRAYRAAAHGNRNLYDVMFGRPVPEFVCDAADRGHALSTFEMLVAGVRDGVARGALRGDPAAVAFHLWVCVHGFVSLELAGYLGEDASELDRAYEATLDATVAPFRVGTAVP